MDVEDLKTLWLLRFEKIKNAEEAAAWGYQEILDRCLVCFGDKDESVELLTQLVNDERLHEKLGAELIQICRFTHTEYGLL